MSDEVIMSNYLSAYDVTSGTVVSITLKDRTLRGECSIQLVKENEKIPAEDRIILEQPLELPAGKQHSGSVSFPVIEIREIEIIKYGLFKKRNGEIEDGPVSAEYTGEKHRNENHSKKKVKSTQETKELEPIEIQLKTYIIRDALQLKVLTKLLKDVDVCGISLEGQNVGRGGIVTWLIMTAGKTLIPFDIDSLQEVVPDLWKSLDKSIFANEKLVKIMHDGRWAADYLWHEHGIKITNVFDSQVADAFIAKEHLEYAPPQLSPLSDCLQMYNRRIPLEELDFLRKFENMDYNSNSPFLQKPLPPPEYLKLCAIKVKHMIPLRENMIVKLMEKYNNCVEAHLSQFKNRDLDEYSILSKKSRERETAGKLLDLLEEDLGQLIV